MTDEENSNERTTNQSDESGGEDVESHSPDSGTTVESTTPDSDLDETSDSSLDETSSSGGDEVPDSDSSPEMDPSADSGGDSMESSSDPSSGSAESASDSTIEVETQQAETATGTPTSTMSETRASVLAAASPSEEATLKRVRAVSKLLDEAFEIPGTNYRVGIDPILGILPVAGDALPTVLSFYPVVEAARIGVPNRMLAKMLALVAIDAVVGSIPVIGTLFDAVWKANKWNLRMLERHIEQRSSGN